MSQTKTQAAVSQTVKTAKLVAGCAIFTFGYVGVRLLAIKLADAING